MEQRGFQRGSKKGSKRGQKPVFPLENLGIGGFKNIKKPKNAKNDVFGALWDPDPGVHFVVVLTGFLTGYPL